MTIKEALMGQLTRFFCFSCYEEVNIPLHDFQMQRYIEQNDLSSEHQSLSKCKQQGVFETAMEKAHEASRPNKVNCSNQKGN